MPEYFDISLILKKTNTSKVDTYNCLKKFGLSEGENETEHFVGKKLIVSYFEYEEANFDEIFIGFPDQIFHKEIFEKELKQFTDFVNHCFGCNDKIQYALCSYELNGYFLGGVKKLENFSDVLLNKFPIIYKRDEGFKLPLLVVNLDAQDILV